MGEKNGQARQPTIHQDWGKSVAATAVVDAIVNPASASAVAH